MMPLGGYYVKSRHLSRTYPSLAAGSDFGDTIIVILIALAIDPRTRKRVAGKWAVHTALAINDSPCDCCAHPRLERSRLEHPLASSRILPSTVVGYCGAL